MSSPLRDIGAITLFVADLDRAKAWYANVFEGPVVFEDDASAVFDLGNTIINLLRVSSATELVAPVGVGTPGTTATAQMTIWVDDADAVCADLARRGVVLVNGPMDREWGQRTACFADPDGHMWEVAQTLERPDA